MKKEKTTRKSILRLASMMPLSIEPDRGLMYLNEVLMNISIDPTYLATMRDESLQISYIDSNNKLSRSSTSNSIGIVTFAGMMTNQGGMCTKGMDDYDREMRRLYADPDVIGIITEIDTGGGYLTAADMMYNTHLDKNKPVVCLSPYLCSAGIKGTLPVDEIIAMSISSIFGSIGVMYSLDKKFAEEYDELYDDIFSDHSPDKQGMSRKYKAGDKSGYRDMATSLDVVFMSDVKKHRPLKKSVYNSPSQIKETLSGGVWTAGEAKKRGLVDSIGTRNQAAKRVRAYAKYY